MHNRATTPRLSATHSAIHRKFVCRRYKCELICTVILHAHSIEQERSQSVVAITELRVLGVKLPATIRGPFCLAT
jgi:hypothetical protein